ncbi:unnamed protein product [Brassica rapa]|uniref:Uncharacterized protein n=2 Tax=Brassica TaxID=3705 RepID=A0A3P5YS75_BRACM|nr:unnamed protein product [Brassica napus]CAG7867310.1 unnamed protein product [Brassica rapa]CDY34895.1 BnaA09g48210D [Brassica napus]VDC64243.1 unnamed protein product [Brassica rapa]
MASLRLWKKVATPLPSGWKMACTTFSSSVENSDPIKAEKVGKMKVFQKLKSLTVETIDLILKEEEKKGVYVTQTDLVRWAKRIDKRNNRPENSLEIFRWMDKKKMVFSPSQLELFVDLLGELKGAEAALAYFDKVEPNFDEMDAEAKNRPAYLKLLYWFRVKEESQTSGARTHVLKFPKVDDPQWAKNSTPTTPAQKRNLFSKLKSSETCCDHLLREMEDQGFCITKADLNRWIKLLEKQGHTQKALEIDAFKEWKYVSFYHQLRGTFNRSSVSWDPSNNIPDVTQVATTGFLHGYANST